MLPFDFRQLSVPERLDLIDQIWETIEEGEEPVVQLSDAQRQDLRRRLDERERNPDATVSWEDAKARILNNIGRSE